MTPDLPVVEPPGEVGGGARVVGVVLAAGESRRFGRANKLLVAVEGEPMVRRAVRTMLGSRVTEVLVVVGCEAGRVRGAVAGLDVRVVENPEYGSGQASSVRAGVGAVPADAAAVVFMLGDMPWVRSSSVDALVDAYAAGVGDALAAGYEGVRGNPVLFDLGWREELLGVEGDRGARGVLFEADAAAVVETGDPGVVRDVDRPDEIEAA